VTGDLAGTTAQIALSLKEGVLPFLPGVIHGMNAPQGVPVQWVLNWAAAPDVVLTYTLAYVFGPVAGANVFLWLSFVLSGLSMFLLTRRLFGSQLAAGLAGFAFAFYPFAVNKVGGHIEFMNGWVLVLSVWRMLELARRPSRRNALLAGCAAAFAMWFTPYFILIAGVAYVTLSWVAFAAGVIRGEGRAALKAVLLSVVPIVALFGALGVLTASAGGNGAGSVRVQNISELYTYSARFLQWFLPDANNLLFGGLTRPYLVSHLHGSNFSESSLYLGLSVVALALTGLVLAAGRVRRERRVAFADPAVLAAFGASAIALAAALFSLAPTVQVLGRPVTMPSGFVYMLSSTWRVYTRFVEVLELGLCILLASAIAWLLGRFHGRRRWAVFAVLALILVVDLWARAPAPRVKPVTVPAEYGWLHEHPGGIVADYPLQAAVFPNYRPLLYSEMDTHPSFQGYLSGSESETLKLGLADLREPGTAPELAALGVRYIVVHPGQPGGGATALRRQHYFLRYASAQGDIWQVGATPPQARVDMLEGFDPLQGSPGAEYRWVIGPAVLGLTAPHCASCHASVTFTSTSNRYPRTLIVRQASSGRVLARARVPAQGSVRIRVAGITLAGGHARLLLSTDIPPTAPRAKTVPDDQSVTVGETALTLSK
jgi:hypothetical protein